MRKILLALLVSIPIFSFGQDLDLADTTKTQSDNSDKIVIGGTTGLFPIYVYGAMSFDYEISKLSFRNWQKLYLSIAGGQYNTWGEEGAHFSIRAIGLTGQKKGHIEAGGGFAVMMNKYSGSTTLIPAIHVGYRFQKPSGGIVFRTGFGIPEAVYLGLGYNF